MVHTYVHVHTISESAYFVKMRGRIDDKKHGTACLGTSLYLDEDLTRNHKLQALKYSTQALELTSATEQLADALFLHATILKDLKRLGDAKKVLTRMYHYARLQQQYVS